MQAAQQTTKPVTNEHRWNDKSDELIKNVEYLLQKRRRSKMHLVNRG